MRAVTRRLPPLFIALAVCFHAARIPDMQAHASRPGLEKRRTVVQLMSRIDGPWSIALRKRRIAPRPDSEMRIPASSVIGPAMDMQREKPYSTYSSLLRMIQQKEMEDHLSKEKRMGGIRKGTRVRSGTEDPTARVTQVGGTTDGTRVARAGGLDGIRRVHGTKADPGATAEQHRKPAKLASSCRVAFM